MRRLEKYKNKEKFRFKIEAELDFMNEEELKSEEKYLNGTIDTIENALERVNNAVYQGEKEIREMSRFISNSYYDMDAEEIATQRNIMEQMQLQFLELTKTKTLLERQRDSAYFGRIDFKASDEQKPYAYYIGIAHVFKEGIEIPLVLDWRAPLSSMYYDFEIGNANYDTIEGNIEGQISLKRQYKTKCRELVYAFDSNLTIGDEILREALGHNADSKMKNIVSSIQAEQNKIIRADEGKNLIVQGVAGSGKTSIALHRIAYLLYKNKIKAKDMLVISPSSLFSNYISNVLPELGEENTPKITFDEIALSELKGFVNFEPRSQMIEALLQGDKERASEVAYKGSFEFFENLKTYLDNLAQISFKAEDIKITKGTVTAEEINKLYTENYSTKAPATRIEWIADYVVDRLEVDKNEEKAIFKRVKKVLYSMLENTNIVDIYAGFLAAIGMPFRCIEGKNNTYFVGYEDVAGLLYVKDFILGVETDKSFKHIVIDEMQDYSPVAIALICKIYPANKTFLGDIFQTFEKRLDHAYLDDLCKLVGNTKLFKLATTYRSTLQIAKHNQDIIGLQNVKNFNREGEEVEKIKGEKALIEKLGDMSQKYDKIAILTSTIADGLKVYGKLKDKINLDIIDESSGENASKISVIPTCFSKGLEFDAVVFVENEQGAEDYLYKNTKYIACTRALHKLILCDF